MITDGNDVFGLCPATLLLLSVVGVEAIMNPDPNPDGERSDPMEPMEHAFLVKRVATWSEAIADDIIPAIVKGHKLAEFARKTLENVRKYGSGRINLHISLLLHASKEMMLFCAHGIGKETADCVKRWFNMMEKTMRSRLFSRASDKLRGDLSSVCEDFRNDFYDIKGGIERPFFHPSLVFVRVALMVCFFTKGNKSKFTMPNIKESQELLLSDDSGDMQLWEHLSGELASTLLQGDKHGLHLLTQDSADTEKTLFFQVIYLPYRYVQQHLDDGRGTVKVPCVCVAHNAVMYALSEFVQTQVMTLSTITKWEHKQVLKWEALAEKARKANMEKVKKKIIGKEKFSRHYYKKHDFNKAKHPRQFLRNTFLLGDASFHRRFVLPATPRARAGCSTTASLLCGKPSSLPKTKFPTIVELCERGW